MSERMKQKHLTLWIVIAITLAVAVSLIVPTVGLAGLGERDRRL